LEPSAPKKNRPPGFFVAIGVAIGLGFGVAINNVGLGIALGAAFEMAARRPK
jgi:F0F1-type ATP synthase membrane subunit c/vacuolar-type H+-ATPase subunit K